MAPVPPQSATWPRPSGLDPEEFLARYWQKQPLLLREAFPGFQSPLSAEELAGLACEENVESRLVSGPPEGPWKLEQGPLRESRFSELPERDWSLLVQDVDKHLPALATILEAFDFLPRWRLDDLMISYAPPGGSVGPHTDAYDVFLLQASGTRHWAIDPRPADTRHREDSELRVLQHFEPQQEWQLGPGDMLYLPPGVAHHGIAGEDCMTWSIGFRAPDTAGMISDLAEYVIQNQHAETRYADPDLSPAEAGAGIHDRAVGRLRRLLSDLIEMDDAELGDWFGRFITEPKPWLQAAPEPSEEAPDPTPPLVLRSDVLVAWRDCPDGIRLFVDGEAETWSTTAAPVARCLADHRRIEPQEADLVSADEARKLIQNWLRRGLLEPGENKKP